MSKSDDDHPEIGKRRAGMVLVCYGDDRPDQFADWLRLLVADFERLSSLTSEFGIDLTYEDGVSPIVGIIDFCERLGIEFSVTMWEGSLISGFYHFGWIKAGTVRSAAAHGKKLLRALEGRADQAIRQKVIADLQRIKNLDEFIERTANDRDDLREKIAALSTTVQATNFALDAANEKISKLAESDTSRPLKKCFSNASGTLSAKTRAAQTRLRSDCNGQSGRFAGPPAYFGRTYPWAHA